MSPVRVFRSTEFLFVFCPQAAWGTYASTVATCRWTVSRGMGFPRSACKASPLGALLTPAKRINVAPPLPVSTCGECTNAGTNTSIINTKYNYTVGHIHAWLCRDHTHHFDTKAWRHMHLNQLTPPLKTFLAFDLGIIFVHSHMCFKIMWPWPTWEHGKFSVETLELSCFLMLMKCLWTFHGNHFMAQEVFTCIKRWGCQQENVAANSHSHKTVRLAW